MSDLYDLAPLRDWYLAKRPPLIFACETLGYYRNGRKADTSRVLRDLGLKAEGSDGTTRRHTGREKAARLARALGADPFEVDL